MQEWCNSVSKVLSAPYSLHLESARYPGQALCAGNRAAHAGSRHFLLTGNFFAEAKRYCVAGPYLACSASYSAGPQFGHSGATQRQTALSVKKRLQRTECHSGRRPACAVLATLVGCLPLQSPKQQLCTLQYPCQQPGNKGAHNANTLHPMSGPHMMQKQPRSVCSGDC